MNLNLTYLIRFAQTCLFNGTKAFTEGPVYYYVRHARWYTKARLRRGFALAFTRYIRNGPAHTHARLLRLHENVYSDSCSSFLCLGLSTLPTPRMVFNRALRLYIRRHAAVCGYDYVPQGAIINFVALFRTTEERLSGTRVKSAWDYRSLSQGSEYRPATTSIVLDGGYFLGWAASRIALIL